MIVWPLLRALMGSNAVRWTLAAFAILGVYRTWLYVHDQKVADRAVVKIDTQAKKLGAAAEKARAEADKPGSAERLKRNSCRDC